MSNTELLIEEIKTLPEIYTTEVLDFVGYLKEKAAKYQPKCPICAQNRDPRTGEPLYNNETLTALKEGDAMLNGDIPATWHNSIEDLDKMLGL